MLRFFIRRALLAVLTLFAISVSTFLLFFAVPANPVATMCGNRICPESTQKQITHDLVLDQPLITQYTEYMKGVFVGRTIEHGGSCRLRNGQASGMIRFALRSSPASERS